MKASRLTKAIGKFVAQHIFLSKPSLTDDVKVVPRDRFVRSVVTENSS
jgi:hypothetical protein